MVIKYGGNAMINDELTKTVINDIVLMKCIGINPIIVHGGGPDISGTLKKMNHEIKFINGLDILTKIPWMLLKWFLLEKSIKTL